MGKSLRERILDKHDHHTPNIYKGECSHCREPEVPGVSVDDCTGQLRHLCFNCLDELVTLFKPTREREYVPNPEHFENESTYHAALEAWRRWSRKDRAGS
ncbi:hypothetical protein D1872_204200 [compost metagenome]